MMWSLSEHSIKTLKLIMYPSEYSEDPGTWLFLGLIGNPLRKLELWVEENPVDSIRLSCIWRSCSHLVALDISGLRIESMSEIIDAYADSRCRVQCLNLAHLQVSRPETLVSFAAALRDDAQEIARTLVHLELGTDFFVDWYPTDELLRELLRTLATNKRLQYVSLIVKSSFYEKKKKPRRVLAPRR
ncbi:hypothetical protein PINS_up017204 [Pythium insidiosum]|nr:hypothetical protein PINS_up017204 [Pythium insidiosum]